MIGFLLHYKKAILVISGAWFIIWSLLTMMVPGEKEFKTAKILMIANMIILFVNLMMVLYEV